MQPRKAKELSAEYAQSIGIPAEHMEEISKALFQTLKDLMNTYDHNMILIPWLGTFFFRVWKIENEVKKCNNILRAATLPVSVLDSIQEKRANLIKMDAIILAEMGRRADQRADKRQNGVHNQRIYKQGCRCEKCKKDHCAMNKRNRDKVKAREQREEYRQKLIKQHNETKRNTTEGMGEQG